MITLRILCAVLAVVGSRAEGPHGGTHGGAAASSTIFRETVAKSAAPAVAKAVSHSAPHTSVGHGPVSHGALSHGPVSHGAVSHGPVSHGAVSHGPVSHGAVSHGPVSHGAVGYGAVAHGPVAQTAVVHAPVAPAVVHAPISAAAVVHAPAASHGSGYQAPVLSQYHAQDDYGRYTFGYNALDSARDESRDAYGNVHGSFSYVDSYGNIQTQHYIADDYGFRVSGTNLPVHQASLPVHRYKRSYVTSLPASTGILGPGSYAGPVSTVNRVVDGPVVVSYSAPYGYDSSIHGIVSVHGTHGYGDSSAGGFISPLLGNADLHGNFDCYGNYGFSYGFQTGPYSLTTYGSHFDQQNKGYGAY